MPGSRTHARTHGKTGSGFCEGCVCGGGSGVLGFGVKGFCEEVGVLGTVGRFGTCTCPAPALAPAQWPMPGKSVLLRGFRLGFRGPRATRVLEL